MTKKYTYQRMLEEDIFGDKDQAIEIKNIFFKYLRYWYWFVLSLILCLIIAFLYMRYTERTYTSVAKISILDKEKSDDVLFKNLNLLNQSSINLEKSIEILKSYPIAERVVRNQNLTVRFYEEGDVQTSERNTLPFEFTKTIDNDSIVDTFGFKIRIDENSFIVEELDYDKPNVFLETEVSIKFPGHSSIGVQHNLPFELNPLGKKLPPELIGNTYLIEFRSIEDAVYRLKEDIEAQPIGENSELLEISYSSESYKKNERVINEIIDVFNQDGINDRRAISLRTYNFIDQRFIDLAKELDSLETDIKDFKQENNIITLDSKADIEMTDLSATQEQLFEVENQLLLLDIINSSLQSSGENTDLLPANIGVSSASINQLVNNYNELVLEYQTLKESVAEGNPQLINLSSKLQNVKGNIFASVRSSKAQLNATKKQLENKNKKLVDEIYNIPAKEKTFLDIKRQQEIKQELYLFLLQKREESAISYAITEPSIKVIEYALSSKIPVSPKASIVYGSSVLLGLGVPFVILYVFFLLDTKVKNRETIEKATKKIPIAGELPKQRKDKNLSFLSEDDNSEQAEAFRVLSYNLNYILTSSPDKQGKVVFCTSTIKGEGKTYVSLNLALVLSSLNHKVLLVGADLRNPQIHKFLDLNKNSDGLSRVLHEVDYDWRQALIKPYKEHPRFDVLLTGSIPPNSTKLLTNPRLKQLFDEARQEYDYIIVDTAPTLPVSDTLLMSSHADATIYVTRANFTERKLLEYSVKLSEAGKLKNMVYVINALDIGKSSAYGYGYNYGYNYGYHQSENK